MHYFAYFVYKEHYSFLEYLCSVCEVPYITKAKNVNLFNSWEHWINIVALLHIFSDNFRASFAKTQSKKGTNLTQCGFKHCCFHWFFWAFDFLNLLDIKFSFALRLFISILLSKFLQQELLFLVMSSFQRVLSNRFYFGNHVFNGSDYQVRCQFGKEHGTCTKYKAYHKSSDYT